MTRLSCALLNMSLSVTPRVSMYNEPIRVTATGLQPRQKIAITASVDYQSGKFQSEGRFEADVNGVVDCTKQPSIGGSYSGVDPVGLLWSLAPSPGQRPGLRFMPKNVDKPIRWQFRLKLTDDTNTVTEQTVERLLLHPAVTRTEVHVGRLRGALFMAKDAPGRLPGVIDLFGTAGGLIEHRAALLAADGFAVFALAYFDYKDLPPSLNDLDLEYFQEAAQWLVSLPNVMPHGCAAIGTSLGGDIVLRMGIHFPEVVFAVPINGFHMLDSFTPIRFQGKPLPTFHCDMETLRAKFVKNDTLYYGPWRALVPTEEHLMHPVEKADKNTHFLAVISEEDDCNPTLHAATHLQRRMLSAHGTADRWQMLRLPGAGHLLEPPYTPHCAYPWHKVLGMQMSTGGDPVSHNQAQQKMWQVLKQKLADHVGTPAVVPELQSYLATVRSKY